MGPKVFSSRRSRFLNRDYLDRTHRFYEKYGGKTIIIARFIPIIRTFAPFVAGIGSMTYVRFIAYNVVGGIAWILILTLAGYFFGNIPVVRKQLQPGHCRHHRHLRPSRGDTRDHGDLQTAENKTRSMTDEEPGYLNCHGPNLGYHRFTKSTSTGTSPAMERTISSISLMSAFSRIIPLTTIPYSGRPFSFSSTSRLVTS